MNDPDWLKAILQDHADHTTYHLGQHERLTDKVPLMRDMLRLLADELEDAQGADNSGQEYPPACACCGNQIYHKEDHAPDCALAAALAAYESGVLPEKGEPDEQGTD